MRARAGGWQSRALGHDSRSTFAHVVLVFVAYAVAERATGALARVRDDDLRRFSLVLASISHRWPIALLAVAVVAGLLFRPRIRSRLVSPWSVLERGTTLRWIAIPLVLLLTWQGSLYEYNWFAGRVHLFDRALVVGLAVAVVLRPAFLLPFVVAVRIVAEQFLLPFGTSAGRNIDRLLVIALVAIAAVHVLYVITGNPSTAPVLLVVTAALAAHFFIPGKGKVGMGWLTSGDASNLPLSSYTTGWLGHTDGAWARTLSRWLRRSDPLLKLGTMLVEVGAIVAATHWRLTRLWLPALIGFHVIVFASTGFWFGSWIVLEVALLVVFWRRSLRDWVAQNATPARAGVTALAVLGASVLFQPPGLAWLDAPVSYGYELEAIGDSGATYHVAIATLAPLDLHLAFDRVQFTATLPATGAYGAVTSTFEFDALQGIETFDDMAAYESSLPPTTATAASVAFIQTFVDRTADRPSPDWSVLAPPGHFWTSRSDPAYDFQEPLAELSLYRVRSIHHDGEPEYRREFVVRVTRSG